MKSKILTITVLGLLLFSCGTKKTPAVITAEPVQPTVTESVTVTELKPELAEGKNLYDNNCGGCHKLYEPKKFTNEEWKPILIRMQKKAHLDDTKMASISSYIASQL